MAIYNAKPATKESVLILARSAKNVEPTNVVTPPDKKFLVKNWFETQLKPDETAYHTKLELLSNKIVELEKQQIEHIIPLLKYTPEYKISQFEKGNIALLKKIIDDLKKQLSIKDETHTKEKIKTEERLNKLESDNRELRKIIDELRAPSKYM